MRLNDTRIDHLSHLAARALAKSPAGTVGKDEMAVKKEIRAAIVTYLRVEEEADEAARATVAKLGRGVLEGSREWDILYRKYYEAEMTKRGSKG